MIAQLKLVDLLMFESGNAPEASSWISTIARRPLVRIPEYELNIFALLVIQAVNEMLEPTSVTEALSVPDAKQ